MKKTKKVGISASRKRQSGPTINLGTPSWKLLICKRCNTTEIKVDADVVSVVCGICLNSRCNYMSPTPYIPKKSRTDPDRIINTFESKQKADAKQALLAAAFAEKQIVVNGKPTKRGRPRKNN